MSNDQLIINTLRIELQAVIEIDELRTGTEPKIKYCFGLEPDYKNIERN